jgi:hypothetical protein
MTILHNMIWIYNLLLSSHADTRTIGKAVKFFLNAPIILYVAILPFCLFTTGHQ